MGVWRIEAWSASPGQAAQGARGHGAAGGDAGDMTFVIKPYPEFGWSISRQRKLDRCPRAYFYHYYLGWNGWLDDAPRERRLAYRLSKLTSLDALLGQEVDARARELEAAARAGSALPAAEELEAHTRTSLRQVWARAKKGRPAFEARPKQVTMLRSLYLRHDIRPETERLDEKVGPSMRGLLATSHWERLRGRGAKGVVEVPDFAHFFWAGVKVYAAPDLAYVHDDVLHVVDWKSGREEATDPTQVLLQMWWALETYPALARAAAAGGLEVRGHLEYVTAGRTRPVEVAAGSGPVSPGGAGLAVDDLREACNETVRAGVARMRALLADPEENIPLAENAFERREGGLCATCNFTPLCA